MAWMDSYPEEIPQEEKLCNLDDDDSLREAWRTGELIVSNCPACNNNELCAAENCDSDDLSDSLDEEEDEWDPDAPDPGLVEHGLEKAQLGLMVALSYTDDEKIKELLEEAFGKVCAAEKLNKEKIEK